MKRLRRSLRAPIRFYMCGEYGSQTFRPHYHACLFGFDFPDKYFWCRTGGGEKVYRSPNLERLWPFGASSIGSVTFESAAYVARYCVQKVTGFNAKYHYARSDKDGEYQLTPEFNHMSLKPGIGAPWLQKWGKDVYPHDYVVINGKEVKPPKYYDSLFERADPDAFEALKFRRELDGRSRYSDNTEERLLAKGIVAQAKLSLLVRSEI